LELGGVRRDFSPPKQKRRHIPVSLAPPISKPTFTSTKWQANVFRHWAVNCYSLRPFRMSYSILKDAVLVDLIQSISSTLLVGTASVLTLNKGQYLSNHLSLWLPV